MNRYFLVLKTALIVFAIGLAAASAHAGDKKDFKSYARQINGTSWEGKACDDVSASAEKDDGWKLHVRNFSPDAAHMFFGDCDENDNVVYCQAVTTFYDKDGKNCRVDRLRYGAKNDAQKAGLVLETVFLTDINETRKGGLLGFGKRREHTCEDAYRKKGGYKAERGRFDRSESHRRCEGR